MAQHRNSRSGHKHVAPSPGGPLLIAPGLWQTAAKPGQLLTAGERARLAVISSVVRLRKGERLYTQGQPATAVFNILTGVAKTYTPSSNGMQHIVAFLFSGDLVGLAQNGVYVDSAEAVTALTGYRIPTSALEALLRRDADLEFEVVCKLSHDLREMQRHAFFLGKRHATAKIALFLQMLESYQEARNGSVAELYLPMSRSDIGAYAGISLEAVVRAFRELTSRRVIAFRDRRHVRIVDRTALDDAVAERTRSV